MPMLTNGGEYATEKPCAQHLFAEPVLQHRPARAHQIIQSLLAHSQRARHRYRIARVHIPPAHGGAVLLRQGRYRIFHQQRIKRINWRLNHGGMPLPGLALVHAEHGMREPAMGAHYHPSCPVLQARMDGLMVGGDVVVIDGFSDAQQYDLPFSSKPVPPCD